MSQSIFIECPECGLAFDTEEWCDGSCPDCGNDYEWYDDYDEVEVRWFSDDNFNTAF